ncbi:unnamed protein product, partial [Choristocarpus tenellus]
MARDDALPYHRSSRHLGRQSSNSRFRQMWSLMPVIILGLCALSYLWVNLAFMKEKMMHKSGQEVEYEGGLVLEGTPTLSTILPATGKVQGHQGYRGSGEGGDAKGDREAKDASGSEVEKTKGKGSEGMNKDNLMVLDVSNTDDSGAIERYAQGSSINNFPEWLVEISHAEELEIEEAAKRKENWKKGKLKDNDPKFVKGLSLERPWWLKEDGEDAVAARTGSVNEENEGVQGGGIGWEWQKDGDLESGVNVVELTQEEEEEED